MPSVFSCHGSFSKLPPKESEKKRIGMTLWHHLLSMIGASLENASKITGAHHIDRNFAKQVSSRCWWDCSPKITWYNCCWRVWLRTNKKIEPQQGRTALCFGPKGFACICTSATLIHTVLTFNQSHFICNLFSITSFCFFVSHTLNIEQWIFRLVDLDLQLFDCCKSAPLTSCCWFYSKERKLLLALQLRSYIFNKLIFYRFLNCQTMMIRIILIVIVIIIVINFIIIMNLLNRMHT